MAVDLADDDGVKSPTTPAQATKKVKEEIDQITKAKFAEPTQDECDAAQKYSQRSDGSRTPKVPADANV